eukprot:2767416-Rhodomonas_salina.1
MLSTPGTVDSEFRVLCNSKSGINLSSTTTDCSGAHRTSVNRDKIFKSRQLSRRASATYRVPPQCCVACQ